MFVSAPLTVKEACKMFKCSRSKLYKDIKKGMPIIQVGGKNTKILIDPEDAIKWMKGISKK